MFLIRFIAGTFTRLGRVLLWVLFWPLGLWRSIRHGSKKDQAAMRRRDAQPSLPKGTWQPTNRP